MDEQQFSTIVKLLTEIRDAIKGGTASAPAAQQSQPAITYAKLKSGAWGIRSHVAVTPGQSVEVVTKTGKVKHEKIDAVVFQGQDRQSGKKYYLCSIVEREKGQSSAPSTSTEAEAEVEANQAPVEEDDVPF